MADQPTDQRTIFTKLAQGFEVVKDGVVAADDDLFTVVGMCMITLMYGEVTTIIGGAATIIIEEKAGSIPLCAETTIDTDAEGTLYLLSGHPETILCGGGAPTIKVAGVLASHNTTVDYVPAHSPYIINGGADGVTIECTETGNRTGAIEWTLYYLPLEVGAYIEAAA